MITPFPVSGLEMLKDMVLNKAGLDFIEPDMKILQLLIAGYTNQQLGENALKKFFGIMESKFPPSIFTLDILAMFCDYESWGAFCQKHSQSI